MKYNGGDALTATRPRAIGTFLVVAALMLWGLVVARVPSQIAASSRPEGRKRDVDLYRAIADGVRDSKGYYRNVIELQADWGYPTSPALTVRLPTLAELIGHIGPVMAWLVLVALLITSFGLFLVRLQGVSPSRPEWYLAVALLAFSAGAYVLPILVYMHEIWAVALILVSLGVRTDQRWWPAVLFGIAAALIRETALVYAAAMGAVALWQRRMSEAAAWAVGGVVFFVYFGWHINQVNEHQLDAPIQSPSWLDVGGWPFIIQLIQGSSFLLMLPIAVAAVLVPLALLGLTFMKSDPLSLRLLVTAVSFCLVFAVVGRDNNIYWGMLYAPIVLIGLAYVPRAVVNVGRAVRRPPHC